MNNFSNQDFIKVGLDVIETEIQELSKLLHKIDENFATICKVVMNCSGKVVVTGVGKSGHIGKKIAATLASTGTPAFFIHSGEAAHGDLGMIDNNDIVILLSYSGNTTEVVEILPHIKRHGIKTIAITGDPESNLSKLCDFNLDASVSKEACPLGLAPSASSTVALALGDALSMSILQARGFTKEDFASTHPGGNLGKKLLIRIRDIMHINEQIPMVTANTKLGEAIIEMSKKCLGMTTIVTDTIPRKILGIFTDGDLRRTIDKGIDIHSTVISEIMTRDFKTVDEDMLASSAVKIMQQHKIFMLPVLDKQQNLVGAFNLHDVFRAGVV